jgi:hypothetical protein
MGTPPPDTAKRLVDRFDQDRKVFQSGDYKEEQLRAEFLNPFFTALGWDMDNKPPKDIIGNLYYPDSPYEFSVMPSVVLGQVYEQSLGKVIRLTVGHQAKVEEGTKSLSPPVHLTGRPADLDCPRCDRTLLRP